MRQYQFNLKQILIATAGVAFLLAPFRFGDSRSHGDSFQDWFWTTAWLELILFGYVLVLRKANAMRREIELPPPSDEAPQP